VSDFADKLHFGDIFCGKFVAQFDVSDESLQIYKKINLSLSPIGTTRFLCTIFSQLSKLSIVNQSRQRHILTSR